MKRAIPILFLMLAACGGGGAPASVEIGSTAPAFDAHRVDGASVRFPPDWTGKPVVIRFWADWCKSCEGEMKFLEAAYQRHRDKDLQIIAINAGQDKAAVGAFVKGIGITYPALLDEDSAIARKYGVVGLPTTYFVDAGGIVRAKVVGEADEATFDRHVLALIGK